MTESDRERFRRYLQGGFALLVGASMGLVALNGGAPILTAVGVAVGGTLVGGAMAWYIVPESIAETPYESIDRGPKPGTRTKQRRRENNRSEQQTADDDGQLSRNRD